MLSLVLYSSSAINNVRWTEHEKAIPVMEKVDGDIHTKV